MLIDKVYDEFATTDWVYTQDNLNPVREIDYTGRLSIDDLRNRMLGNINARLDYLLEQQEENLKAKFGEDYLVDVNLNERGKGHTINLFENSALDYFPDLKVKVLRLQYYLEDENDEPNLPNFDDQMLTNYFGIMKNFDCIDFDDAQHKQLNPDYFYTKEGNRVSKEEFNSLVDEAVGDGEFIGRGTGEGDKKNPSAVIDCAKRENRLIQILIMILTIIINVGKIFLMVQQIITVIDDIVATAVTIWMFGLSAPKIKDLIINFIVQFIVWILSLILKLLYKLLDFRCIHSRFMEFMRQLQNLFNLLMNIISGFKNIIGIAKSLPSAIQGAFQSFLQKFKNFQVNVNVNKQSMRDKLKEAFDFSNFSTELTAALKSGTKNVIIESDLAKDAMDMYNESIKTATAAAKAWSTVQGDDSNALTQGLSKLSNKVESLKVKQIGE